MRTFNAYIEGYRLWQKQCDANNWIMGQYVALAIRSTIGNSEWFRGKNGDIVNYPDKPFFEKAKEESREMTAEEEDEEIRRILFHTNN